jgi:hypothetical protein
VHARVRYHSTAGLRLALASLFGVPQHEPSYLIVPHEVATGADCDGCLIVVEREGVADLVCNSCGAVMETVPVERASARLMELVSAEISSALCPHRGAVNAFPGFRAVEAFIYAECG